MKEYVLNIKKQSKCQICGENRWYALDFHHKNGRKEKDCSPSKLAQACCSKERIDNEISKCEIICVICHRKIHLNIED